MLGGKDHLVVAWKARNFEKCRKSITYTSGRGIVNWISFDYYDYSNKDYYNLRVSVGLCSKSRYKSTGIRIEPAFFSKHWLAWRLSKCDSNYVKDFYTSCSPSEFNFLGTVEILAGQCLNPWVTL